MELTWISFAIVLYANFGVHDRLISESASETARSIVAHEQLFRAGLVGDLFYCVGVVIYATALYVLLRPVSRGIALLAAFLRLVWGLMWLAAALRFFDALRLIDSDDNLRRVDPESLHAAGEDLSRRARRLLLRRFVVRCAGLDCLRLSLVRIAVYPTGIGSFMASSRLFGPWSVRWLSSFFPISATLLTSGGSTCQWGSLILR